MDISSDNISLIEEEPSFPLYNKIEKESKNILEFLTESTKEFIKLFNQNFNSIIEVGTYLKQISLPNKYVCSKHIDKIPGWTCKECSKYTDSIFCHECYKKSKHLHKGHHLYFLLNSGGMCGCGEPEDLYTFCPDHSGPHMSQEQIDEYISKVFEKDFLNKLKIFFDKLFKKLSLYFIFMEKCDLFCPELFEEKFENGMEEDNNDQIEKEKENIIEIKEEFKNVFEYFLDFLKN